jgi:hypothetical protein
MTPKYYHTPPQPVSARVRCPVCHKAVYSRAGIHPQCAVRQSEAPKPKGEPGDDEQGIRTFEQVRGVAFAIPPTANNVSASDRLSVLPVTTPRDIDGGYVRR